MVSVLYLDRYHLGDPLFLNGLARDVLAFPGPLVLVHGAGEAAERALEAQGRFPEWRGGVLAAESESDRALVERAARDLNRRIVHTLNEAGVAAVRLDAGSRGLLRATETGLEVKKADEDTLDVEWFVVLVAQGVVPVVAALLGDAEGAAREVNGGAVAGHLAEALAVEGGTSSVLMLAKSGLNAPEMQVRALGAASLDVIPADAIPEPEAVRAALGVGAEVRFVERTALRSGAAGGLVVTDSVDNKSA